MQILDSISSKPMPSSKSDAFLVIDQVSKVYDTPKGKYVVLEDVNLQVQEGEFICIIGHSGCGKSTLLNMVAGFNQPTTGVVSVQGQLITEPGPERMVVFQNYSLLPWLTAKENIHLGVESVYPDKSAAEHKTIVQENLDLVGLSEAANKKPSQLSGGMKQRVSIARALATRPQMLILDEPFGALDPITREELQEELLSIWQDHRITVLMITHDIDEALFLADRLVMMTNGPSAQIGEILDIPFSRPRNRAKITEDPRYYELRNYALDFLFRRFAHHEEDQEDQDTIEQTTSDIGSAQSTTISPSSSPIATEVSTMQPNKPDANENPYAAVSQPDVTPVPDQVINSEEMSPAMKTGILFALWGVIIATLIGSFIFNPTSTTASKDAETTASPSPTMETETPTVTETATPVTIVSPTLSPTASPSLSPDTATSVSPSPSLGSTPTASPDAVATITPTPMTPAPSAVTPTPAPAPTVAPSPLSAASPTPDSMAVATGSPSPTVAPTLTPSPTEAATTPTTSETTPPTETATATGSSATTPSAADLEKLNQEVFTQINEAWTSTPVTAVSVYLVKVSQTGEILSYEAKSADATQNLNNTPLPKLVKSDVTQTPYTQFEVTFTPVGTLDLKSVQ